MNVLHKQQKTILIASSSLDAPTWGPLAEDLTQRGYDVVAYEADKVASSETALAIHVDERQGINVCYNDRQLALDGVTAAWWRRPGTFAQDQIEWAKQLNLNEERRAMQAALWTMVPENAWLNTPERIRRAEIKIGQLLVAREVGFTIPQTVISNRWDAIRASLPDDIILKMSAGILYGTVATDAIQVLYTTRLANDPAKLPMEYNPFPGYWQPYLEKSREWRITVIGDTTFDVAIYTAEDAKDDWRSQQGDASKVTFKRDSFPDEQRDKCFEFLGRQGLKFGAFDFIEDHDGKITFLECNPNGQYGWLESLLGLPISRAVGSELARIAEANAAIAK